jgi:hypothetical protein
MTRGENPLCAGSSSIPPGQRVVSSLAHNPKVAGSNPAPATTEKPLHGKGFSLIATYRSQRDPRRLVPIRRAPILASA